MKTNVLVTIIEAMRKKWNEALSGRTHKHYRFHGIDFMTKGFSWQSDVFDVVVYATPFYDLECDIPIEIHANEQEYFDVINEIPTSAEEYFTLITNYLDDKDALIQTMLNRNKVVKDILNWKAEYEDYEICSDCLNEFKESHELDTLEPEKLMDLWSSTVGDWLASRSDIDDVDEEYLKMLRGEQKYGYTSPIF